MEDTTKSGLLSVISPVTQNHMSIVFISDLHFDFTAGKYKPSDAAKRQTDFIAHVNEQYKNCILCLAGDFYNDYKKTLSFVKELEKNKITGFFVLGNHDFWSNGTKSYDDILRLFSMETSHHNHFRLLISGAKYYVDDLCVIGDTGWTSFRRKNRGVLMGRFMGLPDAKNVKNFKPKAIRSMHMNWISYANTILKSEQKVLIVTHFPMTDFTEKAMDCWWSSQTELLRSENYWSMFGHTHRTGQKENNHISAQQGYHNYSTDVLERSGVKSYNSQSFGFLEKVNTSKELAHSNIEALSRYYSPLTLTDITEDMALATSIKRRGFKRCAANKVNFSELATTPEHYVAKVKKIFDGYFGYTYIGYTYLERLSKNVVDAVFASIAILENPDFTRIREFITAAVVTGYVYNYMPAGIERMRPIDDYDIIRFYLMFLTMKKYDIGVDSVYSVRKHSKSFIHFGNIEVYLPEVNDLSLSLEEVKQQLYQTPVFSQLSNKAIENPNQRQGLMDK